MILSFGTDKSGQTVQTQISVFTVCYSICSVLTKYPKVCPLFLNFRLITAKNFKFLTAEKFAVITIKLK